MSLAQESLRCDGERNCPLAWNGDCGVDASVSTPRAVFFVAKPALRRFRVQAGPRFDAGNRVFRFGRHWPPESGSQPVIMSSDFAEPGQRRVKSCIAKSLPDAIDRGKSGDGEHRPELNVDVGFGQATQGGNPRSVKQPSPAVGNADYVTSVATQPAGEIGSLKNRDQHIVHVVAVREFQSVNDRFQNEAIGDGRIQFAASDPYQRFLGSLPANRVQRASARNPTFHIIDQHSHQDGNGLFGFQRLQQRDAEVFQLARQLRQLVEKLTQRPNSSFSQLPKTTIAGLRESLNTLRERFAMFGRSTRKSRQFLFDMTLKQRLQIVAGLCHAFVSFPRFGMAGWSGSSSRTRIPITLSPFLQQAQLPGVRFMSEPMTSLSREEIAERGDKLYAEGIEQQVASAKGQVVAIDVHSGDYSLAETGVLASRDLRTRKPEAEVWLVRVGSRAYSKRRRRLLGSTGCRVTEYTFPAAIALCEGAQ